MMMPSIFGENLFDNWMHSPFEKDFLGVKDPLYSNHSKNMMKTDVRENETNYEVAIDLPGFKKEEVNARLENGYLIISASKNLDRDQKDSKGKYIRQERYLGSMCRSFYVGDDISQEEIHAKFEDGILKLEIPKKGSNSLDQKSYIPIQGN